jgi:cobalt-zinc-cadmium efflux system membrane fusion protein
MIGRNMATDNHESTPRGRAFVWGGILLGVLFVALLLTHGFGLLGRHRSTDNEVPLTVRQGDKIVVPEKSPLRERLTVSPAQTDSSGGRLQLPGVVESDPARTAAILPPLGGRVVELKVTLGERVERGQVLAVIDSPDLDQAYDDNDKAADSEALTQKSLERQDGQFKIGASSEQDLDRARSDHTQAVAEYVRTKARLRAFGAAPEAMAHARLLSVTAPFSGSVTSLSTSAGSLINDPTQPIMAVADLSTIWVTALVPEKDIGAIQKGEEAEVELSAYPDQTLKGKVLFISDVVEADSRRNKIRIAFANGQYRLKPNMFASVTLIGAAQSHVVLPTSALLMNNDRTTVFVATAPWTFERRTVNTRLEEGSTVTIESGVNAGEQVVVEGGILLND